MKQLCEKTMDDLPCKWFSRSGSAIVLLLVGMGVGVSAIALAYLHRNEIRQAISRIEETMLNGSEGDNSRRLDQIIPLEQQKFAEEKTRLLFNSAQNTFIHRNGKRFAGSIEELEPGFEVETFGALIHEDIWCMRVGAPDTEVESAVRDNPSVAKAMKVPYRFAIKPVRGVRAPEQDARTTCIIALPTQDFLGPAMVMVAGPIRRDPQDFMLGWPLERVNGRARISELRRFVLSTNACDGAFIKWLGNEKKAKKEIH